MLINLRNALMAGKRPPYDDEVEYLESTGTQYIDTGVIGKPDTIADISFRWVGNQSGDASILGCRNNSISASRFIMLMTNQTKIRQLGVGGSWAKNGYYDMDTDYNSVSTFISGATTQKLNGSTIISSTAALADIGKNLFLFANNSTTIVNFASARVYGCKIYQNGVLVRDYIPVRKGTVGYLYDRVSGKLFGNAGTGDFVLGPDVVPVEWLGSDGNQYIDTGVRGAGSGYLATTFQPLNVGSSSTYWRYFGASNGDTRTERTIAYNAGGRTIFENGYNQFVLGTSRGDVYTIQKTGYNVPSGSAVGDKNFQIFGYNGTYNIGNVRFYNFSLWDSNNILVRSFLPIRVGTDATSWEGAMMDVLTRRIYRNAGTGAFAYGNDLKYPIPAE